MWECIMESAQRPQLSDLRQKRLAYFGQRYSPSPPAVPKPSTTATGGFVSKRSSSCNRDRYNITGNGVTVQGDTGAIPKSYGHRRIHGDPQRSRGPNESEGFSYQQVADKKKSTNQRLSAQEFEIHMANEVDELFQSNRVRSQPTRKASGDQSGKRHSTEPHQGNRVEAASMDYERHLINHLQRPDRFQVNNQIKNEPKSNGRDPRGEDEQQRFFNASRKKHLKKFLYKQDQEITPAVKAASGHDAVYAENILHQMGKVQKLRAQVHGELISSFSDQEFRLSPTKSRSEGSGIPNEEEVHCLDSSTPTIQDSHLPSHPLQRLQHSSSVTTIPEAEVRSLGGPSAISSPANLAPLNSDKEDNREDYPIYQDEGDGNDNLEKEMTFDLGALQKAAKQGDDILRQYIQSLSRNLKKKKHNEFVISNEDVFDLDKEAKKPYDQQGLESGKKNLNSEEENRRFAGMHKPETMTNPKQQEESMYRPKVSQPTVTSVELESLGLFSDLSKRRPNTPGHDPDDGLRFLPESVHVEMNGEVKAESSEDENLGLRTHRPQQRPLSPLKQVMHQPAENQEKQLNSLSEDESVDLTKKHQYYFESNLDDSSKLSNHRGDGDYEQYQAVGSVNSHSKIKAGEVNTEADCMYVIAADSFLVQDDMGNQTSNNEPSVEDKNNKKSPPSYDTLFSNPKDMNPDSVPLPHPSGTEIGNFVCSEQSTDSDLDERTAHKLNPYPPQEENQSKMNQMLKPRGSTRSKTPRRPKTPERHADGIREHHERDRETRRQLSSRKSKSQETEGYLQSRKQPASLAVSSLHPEMNNHLENVDESNNWDALKEEDIFQPLLNQQVYKKPLIGPSGDAQESLIFQNPTSQLCMECNNLTAAHIPECEVCGADIPNVSHSPANLDIPPLDTHLIDGDATDRSHLTTGSAWDIKVSTHRQEDDVLRMGEDNESTVMGKIASFVPKLTNGGGQDIANKPDHNQVQMPSGMLEDEGAGDASHAFCDLPERVDAWLAANETGRISQQLENRHDQLPHPDQLRPSSEEEEAEEHTVTFDLPAREDLTNHLVNRDEPTVIEDRLAKIKPRPSSAGPQRSRQGAARPKSGISKSKTGQLIDSPMYNRRWATSSSTWGSRRSTGDSLQPSGQRASVLESTQVSGSPLMQRKRPSSAKTRASLKNEAESRVKGQRARPLSANVKSRESKDINRSANQKEHFLTVNSAQVGEGLASKSLNSSHSIPPLTLQLICDSPRGGDGLSIWELLPDEILLHIFAFLSYKDLVQCAASCSRFHRIAMDDTLWRTIRLHKRKLTDFSLSQIGERHPSSLLLTQCHGNIVTENGLRNLFRSCADTLQELNVSGCTGGDLTGDSLLLHASRCRHLVSLDASWCQATDNGLSAITDSCQRLTTLCLNGCQSVSDGCLSQVIKKHGRSLRVLEVLGCLQLSSETLQLIGSECRHLHTLNIGQCYKVTDDSVSQIVHSLKSLKHFDLRGCKQIRDNCVRKIVRHCKWLETLVLANCTHITNAAVVEIATYLPTLRSLDVSGCKKVNNEGVRSLATCFHHLTSLDVSSTGIDHKSVSALANYCNKTLVSVRFNCCKDITEVAIVKLLKNCKKLTSLHVYGVKGLRNLGVLKLQYPCLQFG